MMRLLYCLMFSSLVIMMVLSQDAPGDSESFPRPPCLILPPPPKPPWFDIPLLSWPPAPDSISSERTQDEFYGNCKSFLSDSPLPNCVDGNCSSCEVNDTSCLNGTGNSTESHESDFSNTTTVGPLNATGGMSNSTDVSTNTTVTDDKGSSTYTTQAPGPISGITTQANNDTEAEVTKSNPGAAGNANYTTQAPGPTSGIATPATNDTEVKVTESNPRSTGSLNNTMPSSDISTHAPNNTEMQLPGTNNTNSTTDLTHLPTDTPNTTQPVQEGADGRNHTPGTGNSSSTTNGTSEDNTNGTNTTAESGETLTPPTRPPVNESTSRPTAGNGRPTNNENNINGTDKGGNSTGATGNNGTAGGNNPTTTNIVAAQILDNRTNCTHDGECSSKTRGSVCNASLAQCVCDVKSNFYKEGQSCLYRAQLGDGCKKDVSVCLAKHSVCKDDGTNTGTKRCYCEEGYKTVKHGNELKCGKIITKAVDVNCTICENNEGTCYDLDDDQAMDGCVCLISRTGEQCENIHVHVSCDPKTFSMRICYVPHDGVDFSAGSKMYTDGRGKNEACKGSPATAADASYCPYFGAYKLVLPLSDGELATCGTMEYKPDMNTRRFENKIMVQKDKTYSSAGDPIFKTFCSFDIQAHKSSGGIGVLGINNNDRGVHKRAKISFKVFNHLGAEIEEGLAIRRGDLVRFKILLESDGTYEALRVDTCTASTAPTVGDPKAYTLPITAYSCPAAGQKILDLTNTWRPISDRPNMMQTGLVKMFKLPLGHTIFIHCTLKLCLKGFIGDCAMVKCSGTENRRRRSAEDAVANSNTDSRVTLDRELHVYEEDDEERDSALVMIGVAEFVVLITVLVVMLVVLMVLLALMWWKSNRRNVKTNDFHMDRPQRFTLPRIAPSGAQRL